jgi:hypothetical protein
MVNPQAFKLSQSAYLDRSMDAGMSPFRQSTHGAQTGQASRRSLSLNRRSVMAMLPLRVQRACVTVDQERCAAVPLVGKRGCESQSPWWDLLLSSGAAQCKCQDLSIRVWSTGRGLGREKRAEGRPHDRNAMQVFLGQRL